ncbi:hypothetical protein BDQ17DRAFT_1335310 [Cyathus striatus]|nr:hypothetical protein BDQ17DRAFT_1335310 [Cyathus striatus]
MSDQEQPPEEEEVEGVNEVPPMDLDIVIPGPQGLQTAQLKFSKLYKAFNKVHKEKAVLEAAKPRTHHRLQHSSNGPHNDLILKAGHHFGFMYEVWMGEEMKLAILSLDPNFDDINWDSDERKYSLLSPVFFPGWNPKDKHVFASDVLINVGLCLLRGPSTLWARKEGKSVHSNTVVKYWGLNLVTPGFIALVAILTHFGLSGDPEFTPVRESGITYSEDFKAYKLMLYKLYDKPSIQGVTQSYNNVIFPDKSANDNPALTYDKSSFF